MYKNNTQCELMYLIYHKNIFLSKLGYPSFFKIFPLLPSSVWQISTQLILLIQQRDQSADQQPDGSMTSSNPSPLLLEYIDLKRALGDRVIFQEISTNVFQALNDMCNQALPADQFVYILLGCLRSFHRFLFFFFGLKVACVFLCLKNHIFSQIHINLLTQNCRYTFRFIIVQISNQEKENKV